MLDKHIEIFTESVSASDFREMLTTYLVEAALDFVISVDAPDRVRVELGDLGTITFARHATCWSMGALSGTHIKLRQHGIQILRELQGGRT